MKPLLFISFLICCATSCSKLSERDIVALRSASDNTEKIAAEAENEVKKIREINEHLSNNSSLSD